MRKRKLQIFLSSTYEDLVGHRLAAMEAILAAGHIPAAMEQFSPGDESAWDKIKRWIDESDAFILIFGGRYGSINPESGKSYVEMEYEYAIETKKPFFAVVVSDKHHEERLREFGSKVDERENPDKYKRFRSEVTKWHCKFWDDKKDIQNVIFQKLPEWAQRSDLIGWVRGDEATNAEVMNELARLSHENRQLRAQTTRPGEDFVGLTFDELASLLSARMLSSDERNGVERMSDVKFDGDQVSALQAFMSIYGKTSEAMVGGELTEVIRELAEYGLLHILVNASRQSAFLTKPGQKFRNRLRIRAWPELSPDKE
jgi:hypothetical protein